MGTKVADNIETMEDLIKNSSSSKVNVKLEDEDECALYFTSGTTGAPKAGTDPAEKHDVYCNF